MNIATAILATELPLPPIAALGYEYVLAGNGLFIRAEDSRMEACIPIADVSLHCLCTIEPYARLKVERVPSAFLQRILASALRHMPDEAMYQFKRDEMLTDWSGWQYGMPLQMADLISLEFDDDADSAVDLHSHNSMPAFFSDTDDSDEQGLRFYAVIGKVNTRKPEIAVRVGVYGYHWDVPVTAIFENAGPFIDVLDRVEQTCLVCGCTDSHACPGGCYWVELNLCSNCVSAAELEVV